MSDFFDGSQCANTLHNVVFALQRRRTSYLAQAQATDVELYEQSLERPVRRSDNAPDLSEVDLSVSLMMGVHELLQQVVHWTAAGAPKGARRPTVRRLPRPRTAAYLYHRKQARDAHQWVESHLTFVDNAEFDRITIEGGGSWPPTVPVPPPSTSSPA